MSIAIIAYLDAYDDTLYVERDERGPLLVIQPSGDVEEQFRLPDTAIELRTPAEAALEVSEALFKAVSEVKAPRKVRTAIGEALRELGLDKDEVDRWLP